jgi:predicted site-specific integrase-resolvase
MATPQEHGPFRHPDSPAQYLSTRHVREIFDVSANTLRRYANDGLIRIMRTPRGDRLYCRDDLCILFSTTAGGVVLAGPPAVQKAKIDYARVSSRHQRQDLERQVQALAQGRPEHEVITDIG